MSRCRPLLSGFRSLLTLDALCAAAALLAAQTPRPTATVLTVLTTSGPPVCVCACVMRARARVPRGPRTDTLEEEKIWHKTGSLRVHLSDFEKQLRNPCADTTNGNGSSNGSNSNGHCNEHGSSGDSGGGVDSNNGVSSNEVRCSCYMCLCLSSLSLSRSRSPSLPPFPLSLFSRALSGCFLSLSLSLSLPPSLPPSLSLRARALWLFSFANTLDCAWQGLDPAYMT